MYRREAGEKERQTDCVQVRDERESVCAQPKDERVERRRESTGETERDRKRPIVYRGETKEKNSVQVRDERERERERERGVVFRHERQVKVRYTV